MGYLLPDKSEAPWFLRIKSGTSFPSVMFNAAIPGKNIINTYRYSLLPAFQSCPGLD